MVESIGNNVDARCIQRTTDTGATKQLTIYNYQKGNKEGISVYKNFGIEEN